MGFIPENYIVLPDDTPLEVNVLFCRQGILRVWWGLYQKTILCYQMTRHCRLMFYFAGKEFSGCGGVYTGKLYCVTR